MIDDVLCIDVRLLKCMSVHYLYLRVQRTDIPYDGNLFWHHVNVLLLLSCHSSEAPRNAWRTVTQ